jgi:hypothetical protein
MVVLGLPRHDPSIVLSARALRSLAPGSLLVAAAVVAPAFAACDPGVDVGGAGGAGAQGGAGEGGVGAAGSGGGGAPAGMGGMGGMVVCGAPDDPLNCGTCDNRCAPGQTCEEGVCTCGAPVAVSFATDVQPILTASCAKIGCHTGVLPDAGLDLTAGAAYAEIVGKDATQCSDTRLIVDPGKPDVSYIIDKVTAHGICGGKKKMPPLGTLSADKIQLISDWICGGALDN